MDVYNKNRKRLIDVEKETMDPSGKGKVEGQDRGMGLRDIN